VFNPHTLNQEFFMVADPPLQLEAEIETVTPGQRDLRLAHNTAAYVITGRGTLAVAGQDPEVNQLGPGFMMFLPAGLRTQCSVQSELRQVVMRVIEP
jgi:uncharacterized cupin superfamily protein